VSRRSIVWRVRAVAALALVAVFAVASQCIPTSESNLLPEGDPLAGDPIDPDTGVAAEIVPGAPWIRPGPDDELGTADDEFVPNVSGDVDLVVRVRSAELADAFPPPTPLLGGAWPAVAEPFGRGRPIWFMVAASDGEASAPAGRPIGPSYAQGLPILVVAFPDLDGDGFIGRTHLDGETRDAALETLELYPVGRRYAVPRRHVAEGTLYVGVGGPLGMDVALGAAAFAAAFENPNLPCIACHSWPSAAADRLFLPFLDGAEVAPDGPVISTHLPFLPDTDVSYLDAPRGLVPAHPDARVGVVWDIARLPDPADPRVGESFTLRLDGSTASIDVAQAWSGGARRFGLALPIDPVTWRPTAGRTVRPGIGADGDKAPVEIVQRFDLVAATQMRVVPLDGLGNVSRTQPASVALLAEGGVRILSPDLDGDPLRESVTVVDSIGTPIALAPATPGDVGALVLDDGAGGVSRIEFEPVSGAFLYPFDVLFPPDDDGDGIGGPPGGGFTLDDDDDD
jgi:hypothetical protein